MLKEGPRPSRSRGNKEGEVVPAHRLFERPHYAGGVVERAFPEERLTVVTEDDVAWPGPLSEMAGGLLEFNGRLEAEAARVIDGPPGGAPSKN